MTSLARGLAVLAAFSQQARGRSIAQLSLQTGIPRAAVRRCLHTLAHLGYVGVEDERTFVLKPHVLALGYAYLSSTPLVTSARPILDHVSETLHESSSMAILEGEDIMYVARSTISARIMSFDLGVGSRLPAYCTSMGRVLLADLPPTELSRLLRHAQLVAYTPRTLVTREALEAIIGQARHDGYSVVDQELELGLRSIAVPVRDSRGKVAAAINVSVQAGRVTTAEMQKRFVPVLHAAARDLGMLIG